MIPIDIQVSRSKVKVKGHVSLPQVQLITQESFALEVGKRAGQRSSLLFKIRKDNRLANIKRHEYVLYTGLNSPSLIFTQWSFGTDSPSLEFAIFPVYSMFHTFYI